LTNTVDDCRTNQYGINTPVPSPVKTINGPDNVDIDSAA